MVGVFVAFIRVVCGRRIYMSLPYDLISNHFVHIPKITVYSPLSQACNELINTF